MENYSSGKYVLADDGKTPIPVNDPLVWARWFEGAERHVAKDYIGKVYVSTVFLGLDHSFRLGATPLLWETMVFGGPLDQEQDRYASYDDAVKGHATMLTKVRARTER